MPGKRDNKKAARGSANNRAEQETGDGAPTDHRTDESWADESTTSGDPGAVDVRAQSTQAPIMWSAGMDRDESSGGAARIIPYRRAYCPHCASNKLTWFNPPSDICCCECDSVIAQWVPEDDKKEEQDT